MTDLLLLVVVLVDQSFSESSFFYRIIAVISFETGNLSVIQFHDLLSNAVQKVAVVGHHKDTAFIVDQISFQPLDGFHIQMVGGLI